MNDYAVKPFSSPDVVNHPILNQLLTDTNISYTLVPTQTYFLVESNVNPLGTLLLAYFLATGDGEWIPLPDLYCSYNSNIVYGYQLDGELYVTVDFTSSLFKAPAIPDKIIDWFEEQHATRLSD